MGVPITQKQHGDTIKLLMANGTYQEFWIVKHIEEGTKVIAKTAISRAFDEDNTNIFNPNDTNNIGHYLNNTFYNTLNEETKNLIVNVNWNINSSGQEGQTVPAKIGLLTSNEWSSKTGNTHYSGKIPILKTNYEWTLTPVGSAYPQMVWLVSKEGYVNNDFSYIQYANNRYLTRPALVLKSDIYIDSNGIVLKNIPPTINVSNPINGRTLYENDIFGIAGTVNELDVGNVVSVKYSINGGTARAILGSVSQGSAISFAKNLTYKSGKLYDGTTAVTDTLAEGSQHTLKMWAEDDQGGKSAEIIRTFYVVPNRAASLTLDAFVTRTGLINTDVVNVSGKVADLDNGNVIVKYKIGNGAYTQIFNGPASSTPTAFNFNVALALLAEGESTITIQAVDAFGAITQQVLTLKKEKVEEPLKTAVTYYEITPPNGTADGLHLFIERELGDLAVKVDVFMGAAGVAEAFVPMTLVSTANLANGNVEDTYSYQHSAVVSKIVVRITMTRTGTATNKAIKKVSGVLT